MGIIVIGTIIRKENAQTIKQEDIFVRADNVGVFLAKMKKDVLDKKSVKVPAQCEDGTFDQKYAGKPEGRLIYQLGETSTVYIDLIRTEDDQIIYSSGKWTQGVGHLSKSAGEAFRNLALWTREDYNFAE